MTTPEERTRAIKKVETFLIQIADAYKTPGIPPEIRSEALSSLRHYPSDYDMAKAVREAPDVFGDYLGDT